MHIVIDTVSLNHLARPPIVRSKKRVIVTDRSTPLSKHIKAGKLVVVLDQARGLLSEWERTCGIEFVRNLIIHWESMNGICLIHPVPALSQSVRRKLRALGFTDTVDMLVLKLATATPHRTVISDDSDFWDPKRPNDKSLRGNVNAPVARYCRESIQVTVMTLHKLMSTMSRRSAAR